MSAATGFGMCPKEEEPSEQECTLCGIPFDPLLADACCICLEVVCCDGCLDEHHQKKHEE